MEASAPPPWHGEPEPRSWQPRAIWVGGRMLCGSITFFFAAFVFAYFYLDSLDVNHNWKIGPVHPSQGFGVAVMALFLIVVAFSLLAIALQFFEYTTLDFGAASGAYASVFFGWTATYAITALLGIYWVQVQVASLWRLRRTGAKYTEIPADEEDLLRAGIEASSFYWTYFVAIGVLAYIVLYLVGA
jgi:heme/copper-type cytochrome/quinol oxidase subunit 3